MQPQTRSTHISKRKTRQMAEDRVAGRSKERSKHIRQIHSHRQQYQEDLESEVNFFLKISYMHPAEVKLHLWIWQPPHKIREK